MARVGIVGAGPAGLLLASLLHEAGIESVVYERHSRAHVESRARAGVLEHRTVETLRRHGLAGRMLREGLPHGACVFLCESRRLRLDYGGLSGARHWIYPQQLLVRDLIDHLAAAPGVTLRFGTPVSGVADGAAGDGARPAVCWDGGRERFDAIAGCDGHHSAVRRSLPAGLMTEVAREYPYGWLAVLAEIDRPVDEVVYAIGARGFAGLMPRSAHVGRFYLQCDRHDTPAAWPPERVRHELGLRLGDAHGLLPTLRRVTETQVMQMRSCVVQPLRHGRLFLAGDAAHVLTPSGAKGMNLAIADAAALADALTRWLRHGDPGGVDAYAARRLAEVWRVQEFSDRLLRLLHLPTDDGANPAFELRLRQSALDRLAEGGPYAVDFARQYVTTEGAP
jgi:p-hydroxybenzoate 3-monooxygenase